VVLEEIGTLIFTSLLFWYYLSGYKIFAIQFYGECWSGPNIATDYDKLGVADTCWAGVGGPLSYYMYGLADDHQ